MSAGSPTRAGKSNEPLLDPNDEEDLAFLRLLERERVSFSSEDNDEQRLKHQEALISKQRVHTVRWSI